MKQYRLDLNDNESKEKFDERIEGAKKIVQNYKDSQILIQIVEPTGDTDYIRQWLNNSMDFVTNESTNVTLFGMTSHSSLREGTHVAKNTVCSLMVFEESSFKPFMYDCKKMTPEEAGVLFCDEIRDIEDVKGIILMSSGLFLNPQKFIDEVAKQYDDYPIFGGLAGSSDLLTDKSLVYLNNEVSDYAIVAIVLYGKNLHVETTYALGWKPFGREFTVAESDDKGALKLVDDMLAFDVYRNNLGVKDNTKFFENTSPFPLFFDKDGKKYTRVALGSNDDGYMYFCSELKEGDKFFLSYARPEYLLYDALEKANKMLEFQPEALLVYACNNRRALLGDFFADRELGYYEYVLPTSTWSSGYGEVLYNKESVGVLNSALVSVGLREGDKKNLTPKEPLVETYLTDASGVLPMVDRLISFLEHTTEDLRQVLSKLHNISSHDSLTGVYNRTALDHFYTKFQNDMRNDEKIGILMFDIDFFKKVNDEYGHDVGDAVLKRVVNIIQECAGDNDIVTRWGGEEFIMLIPHCNKEYLLELAERIRIKVERSSFFPVRSLTISIGATMVDKETTNVEAFKKVDTVLYKAKETGRNKVVNDL
ncbi:diguanylate cyclase [Lachnospira multipara]|uniref:sensor domain-containing diguanylate cyclase n=1 Tax=Lachnospira multipara TaxID=28051 RepID=UPI0004839099|nr:diguanylate cyclase [Lachnospira multipara]